MISTWNILKSKRVLNCWRILILFIGKNSLSKPTDDPNISQQMRPRCIPPWGLGFLCALGGNQGLLGVASHDALHIIRQRRWHRIMNAQKVTWGATEDAMTVEAVAVEKHWNILFTYCVHQLIMVPSKCSLCLSSNFWKNDAIWHAQGNTILTLKKVCICLHEER